MTATVTITELVLAIAGGILALCAIPVLVLGFWRVVDLISERRTRR